MIRRKGNRITEFFSDNRQTKYCQSYRTKTGKTAEVLFFLKHNIEEVWEDTIHMVNDTPVRIDIEEE